MLFTLPLPCVCALHVSLCRLALRAPRCTGREVSKPLLSAGILGLYGAIGYAVSRPKAGAQKGPTEPTIEATSTDEEDFIKQFVAAAEKEDKEAAAKH